MDFRNKDLINCVNGELINNWGNFVNRTLSFIKSKLDGKIKKHDLKDEIKNEIQITFKKVKNNIEEGKISNTLRVILSLVDYSNKYFDSTEPWKIIKQDALKCEDLCYQYLALIANLSILFNPFIPSGSSKVADWIGIEIKNYDFYQIEDIELGDFQPLYIRITE